MHSCCLYDHTVKTTCEHNTETNRIYMWFWCGVSDAFVPFRLTYHVYHASIYLGFRLSVAEYGNNAEKRTNIAPHCQTMYQIHAKLVYMWWHIAEWFFFFFLYVVSSKNSWGNCRCKSSLTLKSMALVVATADIAKGPLTLDVNINYADTLHLTLTLCLWWCWRPCREWT